MEANSQLINYNLMASLRTGNMITDMAIAMFIPQLMQIMVHVFEMVIPFLRAKVQRTFQRRYRRTILYSYEAKSYLDVPSSNRNNILQTAVRQYIGRVIKTSYHEGSLKLTKIESSSSKSSSGSLADQLDSVFRIIRLPQRDVFEEIEPKLFFMESLSKMEADNEDDDGRKKKTKNGKSSTKTVISLVFETDRDGGEERIQAFINRAMAWYCAEVEKDEDTSRFLYQPLVRDRFATIDERQKPRLYKRYELSSDKTFRSLFFPEKERLLRILDNFAKKTGKYAIKGFPHKLGLLLHGPPGTGKTSLVKAIATYTGRNIVSVPLSRMHTNQELMDVMFDQKFNYKQPKKSADDEGGDDGESGTNNRLTFKDVIFLLEDVDAASSVVHARSQKQSTMAKAVTHAIEREYTSDVPPPAADAKAPVPDAATKAVLEQKALLDMIQLQSKMNKESGKAGEGDGDNEAKKKPEIFLSDKDKLNLSGLLTVLDGVIDAPGRILIMTTNHPEKLDPALTRPGRVNLQIYMGFIRVEQAKQMVRHYYGSEVTDKALECIERAFEHNHSTIPGGFKMSPAEMEQLCAECNTIPELADRISQKGLALLMGCA